MTGGWTDGVRDWWNTTPEDEARRRRRAREAAAAAQGGEGAPKPWARDARAGRCPVPDEQRNWTEKWMWWCVKEFGRDAVQRRVALPEPNFYPVDYDGSEAKIRQLVVRVCLVMCVEPDSVQVAFFRTPEGTAAAKRHAIGTYEKAGGANRIRLDLREAADPARLAGVIAHELAHKRLMGEPRRNLPHPGDERLTDLLTVFLGMGVFTANGAERFTRAQRHWTALPMGDLTDRMLGGASRSDWSKVGYLTESELGYALACHCLLRGETEPPPWSLALDPGPRAALIQGLRHLATRPPRS